jgi:hypothetical protein
MKHPGVTIESGPSDWQIIQRDANGYGQVDVTGTWKTAEQANFQIQLRVVNENTNEPVSPELDWHDAVMDRTEESFTMSLRIPQGGLYRIETRLRRPFAPDKRAMRGDFIHHLGVGDLYLITGQSNASGTGKGAATDGPMLGVHLFANDEQWKLATHPIEDATRTLHPITITSIFHGHSPWLAFGKRLFERTGVPVGLIPTALGGCRITQWLKDDGSYGPLLLNMIDMLQKAGGQAAGIVWYQGESEVFGSDEDRSVRLQQYPDRFRALLRTFREVTGRGDLPVFTGQLNAFTRADASDWGWSRMRELQRALTAEDAATALIVTIDCAMSDEIHNRSSANILIGERFADAALEHIHGRKTGYRFPAPSEVAVDEGRTVIHVRFAYVQGDWTPTPHPTDFSIEDAQGWVKIERFEWSNSTDVVIHLQRELQGPVRLHGLYGAAPRPTLFDDNGRCVTPFSWELGEGR